MGAPAAEALAEGYQLLSECFKDPTEEFARDVAAGLLRGCVAETFARLGIGAPPEGLHERGDPAAVLERLTGAYHALFTVPSPTFVLPVESAFKEWRGDGGFGAGGGMIMGPPAEDMAERYRARGIEVPAAFRAYPDHLVLLLEYGALLARDGERGEAEEFVARHLDGWIETFAAEVRRRSGHAFYRAAADALVLFVRLERRRPGLAEA